MPSISHELLLAIARGDAVAFVGSGPSIASGFPSWPKLLELSLEFAQRMALRFLTNRTSSILLIRTNSCLRLTLCGRIWVTRNGLSS